MRGKVVKSTATACAQGGRHTMRVDKQDKEKGAGRPTYLRRHSTHRQATYLRSHTT